MAIMHLMLLPMLCFILLAISMAVVVVGLVPERATNRTAIILGSLGIGAALVYGCVGVLIGR